MNKKLAMLLTASVAASLCAGGAVMADTGIDEYLTSDYDFEAAAEDMVDGIQDALEDAAEVTANTGAKADALGSELTSDEVSLSISWWGGDSRHEAYQNALAALEGKYPNIKIADNTHYAAWSGWEDLMSTAFYAGNAEDICQVNWNWLSNYSGDGHVFVDLNQYSDIIDLSQFSESALEACTVADELQCIPVSLTGRTFFWNMNVLNAAGVESAPATFEDLLAAGKAFQENLGDDYYPLVLGEYDRMLLMTFYLESNYGKPWVENNELQYSVEEVMDGLKFIQALEDNHVIPSIPTMNAAGIDASNSIDKSEKWINGVYAGIFEWDSAATKYRGALPEDQQAGFTVGDEIKFGDAANGGFSKVSMGLAITESCADPVAAATVINFLLNDPEGAAIIGTQLGIPNSAAGLAAATEAGTVDAMVNEANQKVLGFVDFPLDPQYECADLKNNPGGVYADVFGGLSYAEY